MRQSIFQYRMIGECPLFRRIGEKNHEAWFLNNTSRTNPSFIYSTILFFSPILPGIKILLLHEILVTYQYFTWNISNVTNNSRFTYISRSNFFPVQKIGINYCCENDPSLVVCDGMAGRVTLMQCFLVYRNVTHRNQPWHLLIECKVEHYSQPNGWQRALHRNSYTLSGHLKMRSLICRTLSQPLVMIWSHRELYCFAHPLRLSNQGT